MYHKIIIVGNLGRDPEMRYLSDGTPVTNLSVATTQKWSSDDGQKNERTIWWRVSVWRRQAETCNQYLKTGSRVLIEGRMRVDPETGGPRIFTRNDGTTGASYEVTAQTVRFLGGGRGANEQGKSDQGEAQAEEGSIPF